MNRLPLATSCAMAAVFLCSLAGAQQVVFDLADAAGMGDGSLPGTGNVARYPQATVPGQFVPAPPGYRAVVGTFVPSHTGPTTVVVLPNGVPLTFPFFQIGSSTPGMIGDGMASWSLNDPSGQGLNPDYTGRPAFHSIMASHANAGITFNLSVIRQALGTSGHLDLVAKPGSAGPGPIAWFATTIDRNGNVAFPTWYGGLANNNFSSVNLLLSSTDDYLVLAMTDDDAGTTAGAHGFWGDPHVRVLCNRAVVSPYGNACPDSSGSLPYVGTRGTPCIGRPVEIGAVFPSGLGYVLGLGLSDRNYLGLQLPLQLGGFGADPRCLLLASLESISSTTPSGSTVTLLVPNDITLATRSVYAQGLVMDPRLTTALPISLTGGARLQIGF